MMAKQHSAADFHSESSYWTVFIDTSIDTHLCLVVSQSDTVSDLKKKIIYEHRECFPNVGEITIHALKVKRKGHFYHLSDSMLVRSVFNELRRNWFLFVDASVLLEYNENQHQQPHDPHSSDQVASLGIMANPSADKVHLLFCDAPKKLSNFDESLLTGIGSYQNVNQEEPTVGVLDLDARISKSLEPEVKHTSVDCCMPTFPITNKESDSNIHEKNAVDNTEFPVTQMERNKDNIWDEVSDMKCHASQKNESDVKRKNRKRKVRSGENSDDIVHESALKGTDASAHRFGNNGDMVNSTDASRVRSSQNMDVGSTYANNDGLYGKPMQDDPPPRTNKDTGHKKRKKKAKSSKSDNKGVDNVVTKHNNSSVVLVAAFAPGLSVEDETTLGVAAPLSENILVPSQQGEKKMDVGNATVANVGAEIDASNLPFEVGVPIQQVEENVYVGSDTADDVGTQINVNQEAPIVRRLDSDAKISKTLEPEIKQTPIDHCLSISPISNKGSDSDIHDKLDAHNRAFPVTEMKDNEDYVRDEVSDMQCHASQKNKSNAKRKNLKRKSQGCENNEGIVHESALKETDALTRRSCNNGDMVNRVDDAREQSSLNMAIGSIYTNVDSLYAKPMEDDHHLRTSKDSGHKKRKTKSKSSKSYNQGVDSVVTKHKSSSGELDASIIPGLSVEDETAVGAAVPLRENFSVPVQQVEKNMDVGIATAGNVGTKINASDVMSEVGSPIQQVDKNMDVGNVGTIINVSEVPSEIVGKVKGSKRKKNKKKNVVDMKDHDPPVLEESNELNQNIGLHDVIIPSYSHISGNGQTGSIKDVKVSRANGDFEAKRNSKEPKVHSPDASAGRESFQELYVNQHSVSRSQGGNYKNMKPSASYSKNETDKPESRSCKNLGEVTESQRKAPSSYSNLSKLNYTTEKVQKGKAFDASKSNVVSEKNIKVFAVQTSSLESFKGSKQQNRRAITRQRHVDPFTKGSGGNTSTGLNGMSLLTNSGAMFKENSSGSSDNADEAYDSDATTRDTSHHSSSRDSSDGSYSQNTDGSGRKFKKSLSSSIKDTPVNFHKIFESSSRYKKAKLTASKQLLADTENQPVEFVPDSVPPL